MEEFNLHLDVDVHPTSIAEAIDRLAWICLCQQKRIEALEQMVRAHLGDIHIEEVSEEELRDWVRVFTDPLDGEE